MLRQRTVAIERTIGFAVDAEMLALIENDRATLSRSLGAELTMSQYMRLVMSQRLQHADPRIIGWREGATAAYARFQEGIGRLYHELVNNPPPIVDEG